MNIEKCRKNAIISSIACLVVYLFLFFFYGLDPSENKNIKEAISSFGSQGVYPSESLAALSVGILLLSMILFYWKAWKNSKSSLIFYIIMITSGVGICVFDESAVSVSYSLMMMFNDIGYLLDGFIVACVFLGADNGRDGASPN